jgi:O-antigen ligase
MARPVSSLGLSLLALTPPRQRVAATVLLSLCLPLIFLHLRYQPSVAIRAGSTVVGIQLSDLAVLAVALAGLACGLASGFASLKAGRPLWALAAAFLLLVVAATLHPLAWRQEYAFLTHLVTALKLAEYALLAPALALLLRSARAVQLLATALAAWSAAATGWGLLQFLGLVPAFEGAGAGRRSPSFLGIHDFAALSGAALALAVALLALGSSRPGERRLAWLAGASGALGLVLSAAVAALVGVGLAAAAALAVARARRALTAARATATLALLATVCAGVLLMRAGDISDFARALGLGRKEAAGVETYTQRTLLAYIGLRIFLDHPWSGVGWQGSGDPESFQPYLADARRRFPDSPAIAFPSREHPWGVQNAYLQALADMGVPGLLLFAGVLGGALLLALRAARRAPPPLALPALTVAGWLLVVAGVWNGVGLVAGIPLAALTWIAVGAAAALAAQAAHGDA